MNFSNYSFCNNSLLQVIFKSIYILGEFYFVGGQFLSVGG